MARRRLREWGVYRGADRPHVGRSGRRDPGAPDLFDTGVDGVHVRTSTQLRGFGAGGDATLLEGRAGDWLSSRSGLGGRRNGARGASGRVSDGVPTTLLARAD